MAQLFMPAAHSLMNESRVSIKHDFFAAVSTTGELGRIEHAALSSCMAGKGDGSPQAPASAAGDEGRLMVRGAIRRQFTVSCNPCHLASNHLVMAEASRRVLAKLMAHSCHSPV